VARALDETLADNLKLLPRKVKRRFGKASIDKDRVVLSYLFRKGVLKNRRRNIRKLVRIVQAFSTGKMGRELTVALLFNKLSVYKKLLF